MCAFIQKSCWLILAAKRLNRDNIITSALKIKRIEEMDENEKHLILNRGARTFEDIRERVSAIIDNVMKNGDEALISLERELDKCDLAKKGIKVDKNEIQESEALIDSDLKESIDISIDNVTNFHRRQLPGKLWIENFGAGIIAGEKASPIDSVGLYVPHGKGSFPSVAVMLGVPAKIARVEEITVATPPDEKGNVDKAVLYVCKKLGITDIIKVGGAQAVAAMTFGTQSVRRVSKILGPGSPYVNVAKQLLAGKVDIGLLAGPSESVIIADREQNTVNVCLDLMNEAEHGPDSTALLLSDSMDLVMKVNEELEKRLERIPEPRNGFIKKVLNENGGAIVFDSIDSAISFSNEFAPEHMVLDLSDSFSAIDKVRHSGEILLGPNTPISAGNYIAGPNAVLPTQGFAKSMSALGVRDFLKFTSILSLTPEGIRKYREHIGRLATHEGFPAHTMAARERVIIDDRKPGESGIGILSQEEGSIIVSRATKESRIIVGVSKGERDRELKKHIGTPLQFLNHMIETISWRSGFNVSVSISLEEQYRLMHVVAEDIGITLGFAFLKLMESQFSRGIDGSGSAVGVIDEAYSTVSLSFEGRSLYQVHNKDVIRFEHVEDMLSKDLDNFLGGFAQGGKCTIHVNLSSGEDPHHLWESVFRAFGESLRSCFNQNEFRKGTTPGVKGI